MISRPAARKARLERPCGRGEYSEDGEVVRVVREAPARLSAPLDFLAMVAELWGEDPADTEHKSIKTPHENAEF
jgi:hypothetical protein